MRVSLLHILFSLALIYSTLAQKNNVCSSFEDYYYLETSPNCWYNPDVGADIFEMLARKNMSVETYNVETKDGYIITLFRIPKQNPKGIVFLVHPMFQTPTMWFLQQNRSLGYLLYEAGYELWLPNSRGTYYSSSHREIPEYDPAFWDFSFHEMGTYDTPAALDLVKNRTKRSDIIYIGYSFSTTSAMVYSTLLPEHAKQSLKLIILISPCVYVNVYKIGKIWSFFDRLGIGTVSPSFSLTRSLTALFCNGHSLKILCLVMLEGIEGVRNSDAALVPLIMTNFVSRFPTKAITHYKQINSTDKFQQFDYTNQKNLIFYDSPEPPLYPIQKIDVPVYMIYGGKDLLVSSQSVEKFYNQLPERAKIYGKHYIPEFNHLDFVFGLQYKQFVSDDILKLLNKIK